MKKKWMKLWRKCLMISGSSRTLSDWIWWKDYLRTDKVAVFNNKKSGYGRAGGKVWNRNNNNNRIEIGYGFGAGTGWADARKSKKPCRDCMIGAIACPNHSWVNLYFVELLVEWIDFDSNETNHTLTPSLTHFTWTYTFFCLYDLNWYTGISSVARSITSFEIYHFRNFHVRGVSSKQFAVDYVNILGAQFECHNRKKGQRQRLAVI